MPYPGQGYQRGYPGYSPYTPGYGQKFDPFGRPIASWGARVGAYLIDGMVIGIPLMIGYFIVIAIAASPGLTDEYTGEPTGGAIALVLLYVFAAWMGGFIYFAIFNGGPSGQTLGKRALHIQVRSEVTGGPLGTGKAFLRVLLPSLGGLLCGIPSMLDALWPLWDEKGQALHDKMMGSVVIQLPH